MEVIEDIIVDAVASVADDVVSPNQQQQQDSSNIIDTNDVVVKRVHIHFHPMEPTYPDWSQVKLYTNESYMYKGVEYVMVELEFIYDYNGAIACCWCCFPECGLFGYHNGDKESVFILYDKDAYIQSNRKRFVAKHAYFKRHTTGEGVWEEIRSCRLTKHIPNYGGGGSGGGGGSHDEYILHFYAARASHGFYSSKGLQWRLLGIANDLTGEDTENDRIISFVDSNDSSFLFYSGSITKRIPNHSSTAFQRFFIPCYLNYLRSLP